MNKRALLFVVTLPVAYMMAWLLTLSTSLLSAKEISLRVEGYDPRDLLTGHYLTYQVLYGTPVPEGIPTGSEVCACFNEDPHSPASARWIGACSDMRASDCPLYIRGTKGYGDLIYANIERFYIPEEHSGALLTIPPNATIRVAIQKNGRALVRGMYVDGVPITDWAQRTRSE